MRNLPASFTTFAMVSATALFTPASAQDRDSQIWTTLTVGIPAGERFGISLINVVRAGDDEGGVYEFELGGDVAWEARDGLTVSAGYLYVPNYEGGDLVTREHRLRQQVEGDLMKLAGGQVSGRLRLEQRWRDDGDDIALRLRPYLAWSLPIGPDELSLKLSHESFLILSDTDWNGEARYQRMRNAVSLSRELGGGITGEFGYLNQYSVNGADVDEADHAVTLSLTLGL